MAEKKKAPAPKGHVSFPYPAVEEGWHSVQHLAKAALGAEPLGKGELANHGWVAAGAGLSQVFPTDDAMMAAADLKLTAEEKDTLREFTAMRADPTAFDPERWKKIIAFVLPLLLKLLACLAVALMLSGSAPAAVPQDMLAVATPPQDMLALADKGGCPCGGHCGAGCPCTLDRECLAAKRAATARFLDRWRADHPPAAVYAAPPVVVRPAAPFALFARGDCSGGR